VFGEVKISCSCRIQIQNLWWDRIWLTQGMVQWQALVNKEIELEINKSGDDLD
jgi:hypothetical protein